MGSGEKREVAGGRFVGVDGLEGVEIKDVKGERWDTGIQGMDQGFTSIPAGKTCYMPCMPLRKCPIGIKGEKSTDPQVRRHSTHAEKDLSKCLLVG